MFECFKKNNAESIGPSASLRNGKKPKSKSVTIKEFTSELTKISARTMESNFTFDQLNQLFETLFPIGTSSISFPDLLESLNHHGQILKKPGNVYKLCIS